MCSVRKKRIDQQELLQDASAGVPDHIITPPNPSPIKAAKTTTWINRFILSAHGTRFGARVETLLACRSTRTCRPCQCPVRVQARLGIQVNKTR